MPEPEFIVVGKVLAPWGTQGQVRVQVLTDFPQRFAPGAKVYIDRQPMTIDHCAWRKGNAIIKLRDIGCFKEAEQLRHKTVEIHHSQLQPLPEGQYYHFQLIGLEVWTIGGELVGKITEVLTATSNDNYVVSSARGKVLIPAIADVIKSIDLNHQRLVIEPMAGLLTLNEKGAG